MLSYLKVDQCPLSVLQGGRRFWSLTHKWLFSKRSQLERNQLRQLGSCLAKQTIPFTKFISLIRMNLTTNSTLLAARSFPISKWGWRLRAVWISLECFLIINFNIILVSGMKCGSFLARIEVHENWSMLIPCYFLRPPQHFLLQTLGQGKNCCPHCSNNNSQRLRDKVMGPKKIIHSREMTDSIFSPGIVWHSKSVDNMEMSKLKVLRVENVVWNR